MLAAIPYTTFPDIDLRLGTLRTFGLMVALGVLLGAWIAAVYGERFGVPRDETYRVGTWMVLAGIIGSRLTWVASHTDQIDSPVDIIAIWEGGIQFSGGFIAALIVGLPFFRRWRKLLRWQVLDGYALGLSLGLAFGRVGCYSVGEHFGRTSDFFLASRYDGGEVREPMLGDVPLVPGTTFHNTSLYELVYMLALFALLGGLVLAARRRGREVVPGTLVGVFVIYYGIARFASDSLRVNDERVAGMTGAQWMCLVMIPAGIFILWKVRPRLAVLAAAEAEMETETGTDTAADTQADAVNETSDGADTATDAGSNATDAESNETAASNEAADPDETADSGDPSEPVESGSTETAGDGEPDEPAGGDSDVSTAPARGTKVVDDGADDESTVPRAEG